MTNTFGVMLDCSRNAVMALPQLKKFLTLLHRFGYNSVQLYTEETYEIDGEPYFGYMRGRYTKEELKELNCFCRDLGMELIPCIQTLAHLNQIFRWPDYNAINDADDILLAEDPRTYQLLDNAFRTLSETFTSRKVNIGMDEAHMLGLGRYLDLHGYTDRFQIMTNHLQKVVEIAGKYGFSPMMWSDMYFRLINQGGYYGEGDNAEKQSFCAQIAQMLPAGVTPIYWDYYHTDEATYEKMIDMHRLFGRPMAFAGGAWVWKGFCPDNQYSFQTMLPAMRMCRKKNVETVFITLWGDNGKECSFYAALPALFAIRQFYDGNEDMADIGEKFAQIVGVPFDAFVSLDDLDKVGIPGRKVCNPTKYMLYNDPFLGQFDSTVSGGEGNRCAQLAQQYRQFRDSYPQYGYLFDNYYHLARVMELKYELGVHLRSAYRSGDKDRLTALYRDLLETADRLQAFISVFCRLWNEENKPFGLEVQQLRLGGLHCRLLCCAEKLNAYLKGEIPKIEELSFDILDVQADPNHRGHTLYCNNWSRTVSPSVV